MFAANQIRTETMNKIRIVVLTAMIYCCAFLVFGKKKDIPFDGNWDKHRKSILELPIIGNVEETDGLLQLDFLSDLGNIVVTILDAGGNIVYQQEVLAEEGIPFVASLEELSIREGTVIVSNGNNTIFGKFIY